MMKLSVLLGGAAAAEFRGFGAGFPDLFANDGFGSMPSMFNEQEKHTDNHQPSAFGSMLDGGDMMDGGMFSDMDRESKQMEDSMNSNSVVLIRECVRRLVQDFHRQSQTTTWRLKGSWRRVWLCVVRLWTPIA